MEWFVDEFFHCRGVLSIKGWAFQVGRTLTGLEVVPVDQQPILLKGCCLASEDVASIFGAAAANCRFACTVTVAAPYAVASARLYAVLDGGDRVEMPDFIGRKMSIDPFHKLFQSFIVRLRELESGNVLEIGSRNRSGAIRKGSIPAQFKYTGLDIIPGENVDVVGDAHELHKYFDPGAFDAIFAMSTFEHLLMPWKVVIEMNHVLKRGGLVMLGTHQSWPLHERPWDFWRFSDHSWQGLFNRMTGFEILETAMGEPASIVPHVSHQITCTLETQPAFLTSAVMARKIWDTALTWPVTIDDVLGTAYPV